MLIYIREKKKEEKKVIQRGEYDSDQSDSKIEKNKKTTTMQMGGFFSGIFVLIKSEKRQKYENHQIQKKNKYLTK